MRLFLKILFTYTTRKIGNTYLISFQVAAIRKNTPNRKTLTQETAASKINLKKKERTSGRSPEVIGSLQRRRPLLLAPFDAKPPVRGPGPRRTRPHGAGHACCTGLQVGRRHGPHGVAPSTCWYHLLTATLLVFGTGSVYWTIAAAVAGYQPVSSLVGSGEGWKHFGRRGLVMS